MRQYSGCKSWISRLWFTKLSAADCYPSVCFRVVKEEEGEIRPLVLKTDRESVLRGEDYWIDYREVKKWLHHTNRRPYR